MTTVVYRDGVLAADGRSTVGNGWISSDREQKLFRMKDGSVAAVTGEVASGRAFIAAIEDGKENLDTGLETRVVILSSARLRVYEGKGWFDEPLSEYRAYGTGTAPAMAALHMGADAMEAVRIACLVDTSSGGLIAAMAPEPS